MINQDERVQKVAKAIYEAGDGYMSGVRYDNPYVKGNVFREGKAVRQAEAAIAALAPDLPADLYAELVIAGLPTTLDALWDVCEDLKFQVCPGAEPDRVEVDLTRTDGTYFANISEYRPESFPPYDLARDEQGATPHIAVARLALALHAKAGGA